MTRRRGLAHAFACGMAALAALAGACAIDAARAADGPPLTPAGVPAAGSKAAGQPAGAAPAVTLARGWMRPAAAGTPAADAYVDVAARVPVELVAFTTPWAEDVAMLTVRPGGGVAPARAPLRLDGGGQFRFALHGNVLRLVTLRRDALIGDRIPLVLAYRDARGVHHLRGEIVVHGIVNPAPRPR